MPNTCTQESILCKKFRQICTNGFGTRRFCMRAGPRMDCRLVHPLLFCPRPAASLTLRVQGDSMPHDDAQVVVEHLTWHTAKIIERSFAPLTQNLEPVDADFELSFSAVIRLIEIDTKHSDGCDRFRVIGRMYTRACTSNSGKPVTTRHTTNGRAEGRTRKQRFAIRKWRQTPPPATPALDRPHPTYGCACSPNTGAFR
jgi:hypothetical protein